MRATSILLAFAIACSSSSTPDRQPDGNVPTGDAPVVKLPRWMLEDVQPQSPRVGQTYGLDTFASKIVVVVLLEGF